MKFNQPRPQLEFRKQNPPHRCWLLPFHRNNFTRKMRFYAFQIYIYIYSYGTSWKIVIVEEKKLSIFKKISFSPYDFLPIQGWKVFLFSFKFKRYDIRCTISCYSFTIPSIINIWYKEVNRSLWWKNQSTNSNQSHVTRIIDVSLKRYTLARTYRVSNIKEGYTYIFLE